MSTDTDKLARELLATELDAISFPAMAAEIRDESGYNTCGAAMVRAVAAALRDAPAGVPELSAAAQRKLSDLQAQGYVVNGYALMRPGEHERRVMIDSLGHVRWSSAERQGDDIKAAYIRHFGSDDGWLDTRGSAFIEGYRVARQPAGRHYPELREAAKAYYNATMADTKVRIGCPTEEHRDRVFAAGERLRAALIATPAQAVPRDLLRGVQAQADDPNANERFRELATILSARD